MTEQLQPVEILFGAYRRQVLGLLLLRPDERFHVRGIARLTGVPVGSLHRELARSRREKRAAAVISILWFWERYLFPV